MVPVDVGQLAVANQIVAVEKADAVRVVVADVVVAADAGVEMNVLSETWSDEYFCESYDYSASSTFAFHSLSVSSALQHFCTKSGPIQMRTKGRHQKLQHLVVGNCMVHCLMKRQRSSSSYS